jgi:drug/metabolite transporter (DMT)-like permease
MGSGASMLMGSGVLLLVAVLLGEILGFAPLRVSGRSLLALAYLIAFGSVIAFTAYFWLIQHTTPAKATTYAYVNPVLALLLGWAVAGEPVTSRVLLAV